MQLPSQKAWAAGLGGLLAFLIIAGLKLVHLDLGGDGNAALYAALIAVIPGVLAHFVPPADQDVLAHVNDEIAQAGVIIGKLTAASDQNVPPTPAAKALAAKVD